MSGIRHQHRAGKFIGSSGGARVFEPTLLPVDPAIDLSKIQGELSGANVALGRIDSITDFIPDPELFVFMYVRQEAVLSSQIEGTQASLGDLLEFEAGVSEDQSGRPRDVDEIAHYIAAMNHGLDKLETVPLSMRLLKSVHRKLLSGGRGKNCSPGQFRRIQNWIGPEGRPIEEANFVPPSAERLGDLLGNLESYFHADDAIPPIVRAGICHAQFETIHPFLDGNGRLGRLLITMMLCEKQVLRKPLLYLSAYFKKHRSSYYEWLMVVRQEGDWEGWLRFFLTGVEEVANEACSTARGVLALKTELEGLVAAKMPSSMNGIRLLNHLYLHPVIQIRGVEDALSVAYGTANNLVSEFEKLGIIREITGRSRDRVYRFQRYLDALNPG